MWAIPRNDDGSHRFSARADSLRQALGGSQAAGLRDLQRLGGRDAAMPQASSWGACPLCGTGEGGGEHLVVWCPAVAAARYELSGADACLGATVASREARGRKEAAELLHQASFLHGCL